MAVRRSDRRGDEAAGLTRAQTLDLCARLSSYAEAGAAPKELLVRAGGEASRRFADDLEVLVAVGRMHLLGEQLAEAEPPLRRAIRIAPRDPHALRLLGEVMLRRGDPAAAHAALSAAVASGMNDPWTKTWVARALDYAELLPDLGAEGIARDVRQVLGKPGQGPPDDERRRQPDVRPSDLPRTQARVPLVRRIDKGVYFAGDPRAELPDHDRWGLAPEDILDLPTPAPGGVTARDGSASPAPPASEPVPSSSSLPGDDTEISAWVPEMEQLREQGSAEGRRSGPPPVQVQGAAQPPPLQRIAASELFDEFTEHQRRREDLPLPPGVAVPAKAPEPARRGPPPLPPEPARDAGQPLPRVGPPPLPPEPATALSVPIPSKDIRESAPLITVLGGDEHGPVTAPPSALIPLEGGPVTAPPSALIPLDTPAPPSALHPPPPPSLEVPSALLLGDRSARAGAPEAAPPPGAAPAARAVEKRRSRLQTVLLRAVAGLAVVGVLAGGFELYKRNRATKIRSLAAQAHVALHVGGPRGVADAEAALAQARGIDRRNRAIVLTALEVRFFAVLDVDPERLPDLVTAIEDASAAGARSSDLAFAQVARAAASNDAASAVEMIAHHDQDPDRGSDPLYQLAAGAAIEPQDSAGAIGRYRVAVQLDPDMLSAHVRLVRALAFSGQAASAKEMLGALQQKWPDRPEMAALAAIVAAADPAASAAPPAHDTDPDMLPRPLRAAARALAKGGGEQAIAKALSEADIAPIVVLCGEVALRAGHEATAREAAHRAVELTPSYAPAYALAARVALAAGRFEEARQAALRAPADVAAEVLALIAYEAGDLPAMLSAAGRRANEPATEPVAAGISRLRAIEPIPSSTISDLAKSGKPWADVIALDAALDAGDLELAQSIAGAWTGADKHPIRATRIARLLRYQGKNGAAQAAAGAAAPTTASRVEGALAAAEMASARLAAATTMQSGRTVEERWAAVFLLAREGRPGPARVLLRTLPVPAADSSLLLRTVAALALGELRIKKPGDPMFVSLAVWTKNPDVARALGVSPAAPGGPPPKPVLRGRLPRPDDDPY